MAGFAAAGWLTWFSYDLTTGLPDRQALRGLGDMSQATTLFDVSDKPVFTIYKEQRIEVPLSKVSQNLIKAVVSVEDQRFFDHSGIDAVRILGAVLKKVQTGRRAEGGSTITQQLARQSFLTRDKTYRRKLKEVILAALHREPVQQGRDPRAVPEQGVLRRRAVRRRGRRPADISAGARPI